MKKKINKGLALVLSVVMLLSAMSIAVGAIEGKPLSEYNVGDIIEFGSYPQSEVKDSRLISKLNSANGTWKSYGYMSGAGTYCDDGSAQPSDYMQYKDVTVDGNRYRAVNFSTYRKSYINYRSDYSTDNTNQVANGYYINTTYWFKFESIEWRVLDPQLGFILCYDIIDSQPYSNTLYSYGTDPYDNAASWKDANHTIYANDYAESSIRTWLNDDFYYTAFSGSEQENIKITKIDNKAYSTSRSQFDTSTRKDKVFLLAWDDVLNTDYGFSSSDMEYDINRRAAGSDYAKCQGLSYSSPFYNAADGRKTNSWLLRSAGYYSSTSAFVHEYGYAFDRSAVDYTGNGIRPALVLNPETVVIHKHKLTTHEAKAPTCTEIGWETYETCSKCDYSTYKELPATNHKNTKIINEMPACSEEGYTGDTYCEDCGRIISNGRTIEKLPHTVVTDKAVAPTCTETGLTAGEHCSVCGTILTSQEVIPATGHTDNNNDGKCDNCEKDLGTKPSENKTFGEKIKDFFQRIMDWLRNLFK